MLGSDYIDGVYIFGKIKKRKEYQNRTRRSLNMCFNFFFRCSLLQSSYFLPPPHHHLHHHRLTHSLLLLPVVVVSSFLFILFSSSSSPFSLSFHRSFRMLLFYSYSFFFGVLVVVQRVLSFGYIFGFSVIKRRTHRITSI